MMFAYQSVEIGRTKMLFGFKPCLKGLLCWLINNHNSQTLKIQLPEQTYLVCVGLLYYLYYCLIRAEN